MYTIHDAAQYLLSTWVQDAREPDTLQEAICRIDALRLLPPDQRPLFIALAEQMAAKHSVRDPAQGYQPEAVWYDDPVEAARSCDSAVWTFELPRRAHDEVMRHAIFSAQGLGLAVFDERLRLVYLPSGRILPDGQRAPWDEDGRALDLQVAFGRVFDMLSITLMAHGFRLDNLDDCSAAFLRYTQGGRQIVTIYAGDIGREFRCNVAAFTYDTQIELLAKRIFETPDSDGHFVFNLGTQIGFPRFGMALDTAEDAQTIGGLVRTEVVPTLDIASTLSGLERLMNTKDDLRLSAPNCHQSQNATYYCNDRCGFAVMAAWLTGNPALEDIVAFRTGFLRFWVPSAMKDLERTVSYLGDQPTLG